MREIKFRAWDSVDRQMWEWLALRQSGFKILTDPAYSLMQYTGLKDKNGREIYEGDIVKMSESWGDEDALWAISFGEGHYDDGHYKFQGFYLDPINFKGLDEEHTRLSENDLIVIGNIYEKG